MHRRSDFYQIFFFFFKIVYNHAVVISSEDSHIVHDHIKVESKVYEKLDE